MKSLSKAARRRVHPVTGLIPRAFRAVCRLLPAVMLGGCAVLNAPAWSPDGRYVAWIRYTPPKDADTAPPGRSVTSVTAPETDGGLQASLYVFDMREGKVSKPSLPGPLQMAWGPAGLYVTAATVTGTRIYLLEPPEFSPQELDVPEGSVFWATPSPDGTGLFYCRSSMKSGPSLVFFSYATGKEQVLSSWGAAAFSAGGNAVLAGGTDNGAPALLEFSYSGGSVSGPVRTTRLPGEERIFQFPLVPVPSAGGTACWLPGEPVVWVVPAGGGPKRFPVPGPVRFLAWNGKDKISLVIETSDSPLLFAPAELNVSTGKLRLTGPSAEIPYGFGAWNPAGTVYAEVSRGGLKIEPVTGTWVRYLPQSPAEKLAAAEALRRKSPLEALYFLSGRPPEGVDGFRWYLTKAEAAAANDEPRTSARAFLQGFLSYPVTGMEKNVVLARIKDLPLGMEEAAAKASELLTADDASAGTVLDELEALIASEDLLAGIRFRRGFLAFKKGDFHSAARNFEKAARCGIFPQADYAALLAMISYHLEGRNDMASDMTSMIKARFGRSRAVAASFDNLRSLLDAWGKRPGEISFPIDKSVRLEIEERADYRLRLSLDPAEPVKVRRLARMRLALVTKTPNNPLKDEERRELTEMTGAFAGFAKRKDSKAFAVAGISGRDISVVAVKLPGYKLIAETISGAFPSPPPPDQTLDVRFSPSGSRLFIRGAGIKKEIPLPETRKDR